MHNTERLWAYKIIHVGTKELFFPHSTPHHVFHLSSATSSETTNFSACSSASSPSSSTHLPCWTNHQNYQTCLLNTLEWIRGWGTNRVLETPNGDRPYFRFLGAAHHTHRVFQREDWTPVLHSTVWYPLPLNFERLQMPSTWYCVNNWMLWENVYSRQQINR